MKNKTLWIIGGSIAAIAAFLWWKNKNLKKSYSEEGIKEQERESAPTASLESDEFYVALGASKGTDTDGVYEGSKGRYAGTAQLVIKKTIGKGTVDGNWKSSDTKNLAELYSKLGLTAPFSVLSKNGKFFLSKNNFKTLGIKAYQKYPNSLKDLSKDPEFIKILSKYGN